LEAASSDFDRTSDYEPPPTRRASVAPVSSAARHVVHILDKLGYDSRAQIAVWAAEHGLL
jgi:hypothetical protein